MPPIGEYGVMKKLGFAVLLVVAAPAARADVPPPPGYVEQCQVAKVQKKGEFCTACSGSYYNDTEFCERRFSSDSRPWKFRCRTGGASVWTEIWCTPWTASEPPKLPKPVPKS